MTPHNEAKKEDIASVVLMPGDPKRAKYIAENYLTDYKLVNEVRGMYAFTGYYKNKRITVMASGMGIPSMGIYSYELFKLYDVDVIIRIGSIGALDESLKLYNIILADESYSESSYARVQNGTKDNVIASSKEINEIIKITAKELNIDIHEGRICSSDAFYRENPDLDFINYGMHCLGTEMESFALFHNANVCGKKAACIATVSDHIRTGEELPPKEREKSFAKMMELALETILKI